MTNAPIESTRLPSWIDALRAVEAGHATPLERFIAANEPTSVELRDPFRTDLAAALAEVGGRRPLAD